MSDRGRFLCPCTSGEDYIDCCKPFHDGDLPENALKLMRSRFSAYALDIPEYIIETTHPANPQYKQNKFAWKRNISQFSKSHSFNKLEILDFEENKTVATVTFIAYLTQDNKDCTFTEKSFFEYSGGRWMYLEGIFI